jgi:high frequency lysogenization protein
MRKDIQERTIALAALAQFAREVQKVAHEGRVDSFVLEAGVNSLFCRRPERPEEPYGGIPNLRNGFTLLRTHLGGDGQRRDLELTSYVMTLLHLERKLARRRDLLDIIADGLQRARRQAEHFGSSTHSSVIANLADLYVQTLSTLKPRVMVAGTEGHLSNPTNAKLVRALLLSGIRAAVLWTQSGGTRWKLLLQRRALIGAATQLEPIS